MVWNPKLIGRINRLRIGVDRPASAGAIARRRCNGQLNHPRQRIIADLFINKDERVKSRRSVQSIPGFNARQIVYQRRESRFTSDGKMARRDIAGGPAASVSNNRKNNRPSDWTFRRPMLHGFDVLECRPAGVPQNPKSPCHMHAPSKRREPR